MPKRTLKTAEDATAFVMDYQTHQKVVSRWMKMMAAGRPGGPPISPDQQTFGDYWSGDEADALFEQACAEHDVSVQTIDELNDLETRRDLLRQACDLLGVTPEGRLHFSEFA
jgi:hypothetical protein